MARRPRSALRRYIRVRSVRQGLLGGSRFWFTIFLGRYCVRWFTKVTKRGAMPVVFSEKLALGETVELRHLPPDKG